MPTVSVVVPTYNRADRLSEAIKSVLNQRFEDFELVVVDDASTDDTESVLDSFDDSRLRYVSHTKNQGGSAARNTGIEASDGTYIAFLDDDDEWLPGKLKRQVECLERRSSDWVSSYCDYRVRRQGPWRALRRLATSLLVEGDDAESKPEGGAALIPATLAMEITLGGTSSLVVRRWAVERIGGFDPAFERHQDWEFLVRLLRIGRIAYVDEELWVKNESSNPSPDAERNAKQRLFEKFQREIAEAERLGWDVTANHRFGLAKSYLMEGRFRPALRYLEGSNVDGISLVRATLLGLRSKAT